MSLITSDVREFNWLERYLVTKADMLSFQTWLQSWASIAAQQTGLQGVIVSGLATTATAGGGSTTNFATAVGFGTDATGKPLIVNAPLTLAATATYATVVKCLLVLKFVGTGATPTITEIESGNLHTLFGATLELLVGTLTAYPAVTNNALILMGVTLSAAGVLTSSDYSVSSYPRMGIKGNAFSTNSNINPALIPIGTHLVHYEMTLDANMTVLGTLITGNLKTTGFTLNSTNGKVVSQY